MLNDGKITPELHQSLRAIIQQQPSNPKPYMTLGMVAFQNGDFAGAIAVWEQYLQREDADERAADLLQRSVAVARKQMEESQTTAVAQNEAATDKPVVQVTVSVADDVRAQLAASDVLFIYAKAVNGPPMPLAVVRQPVGQWPVQAQLSDANAMTPMATLSKFAEVIVQARISPTGNAVPQSGDWVGPTQVIKLQPGQQAVALEITSRMP
jgi:cytochrome c-type biogenesis protein CcmH